ncbi:ubiquinol oxidase subunit II [Steroidobacter sp.]|uniref:ubiquinol oxidase subunit II n=1 Tax=Steroidobacter sp. TaxID=1978227 RepID=UPI0025D514D9|nr:ubiquinol oxidase subunit II [Steroidobacter sp.]
MKNRLRILTLLPLCLALAACDTVVLNPSGDVAAQQRDLLVMSTWLMLLIIIPVMALIVIFAWRYRHNNREARYEPDWHHSMRLELIIWSAPLLIVICLGALTWLGTHLLDPYRPLDRLAPGQPVPEDAKALQVEVVALDWKWLFIYPEQGIATVNELAVPVNQPVALRITASSVMNSLYIPHFAGMIYAMPSMETKLHGVLNKTGVSEGFSSNYSGAGFSGMRFKVHSLEQGEFERWVANARASQETLTRDLYLKQLAKPSEREPVRRFSGVDAELFSAIVGMCVEPGKMCMHDMMAIDERGGLGLAGVHNVARMAADQPRAVFGSDNAHVIGLCTAPIARQADESLPFSRVDRSPLKGAGLPNPSFKSAHSLFVDTTTPSSLQ